MEIPKGLVVATIYSFPTAVGPEFLNFFTTAAVPELKAAGVAVPASYVTETSPNNFPRLPVRDKEHVLPGSLRLSIPRTTSDLWRRWLDLPGPGSRRRSSGSSRGRRRPCACSQPRARS